MQPKRAQSWPALALRASCGRPAGYALFVMAKRTINIKQRRARLVSILSSLAYIPEKGGEWRLQIPGPYEQTRLRMAGRNLMESARHVRTAFRYLFSACGWCWRWLKNCAIALAVRFCLILEARRRRAPISRSQMAGSCGKSDHTPVGLSSGESSVKPPSAPQG